MGHATPRAYREAAAKGEPVPKKPSKIKYERNQKAIKEAEEKRINKKCLQNIDYCTPVQTIFLFLISKVQGLIQTSFRTKRINVITIDNVVKNILI